ncbi:adult-specific rigid cuticular protein 15.5-like [Galendromus occidentalis]|uniref:Adult-specific rigid cuticular protein 15.5-like n=1 Tax=Galendromus occidentalis TaxID=34638 RepID=A0AAJ7SGW8_9ACAR|nr:adult-specific rigid cuticular protein 15.5-like [Galendromus occidentalis]
MKVLVVFTAVAAVANAGVLLSSGNSVQHRSEDGLGNYAFGYNEQHSTGGSSRQESGSPGVKVGSYSLNVADGRQRTVNYVADGAGFRASIATNEQGTAPSLPAAAAYNAAAAPISAIAAPAAAIAAPAAAISSSFQAIAAAPIAAASAIAAPIAASFPSYAVAPVAVAKSTAYSTAVNHGAIHAAPIAVGAPAYAGIAAPAAIAAPAIAAPAAYAANVYAPSGAWAHGLYGYGYNHAVRAW